MICKKCNQDRPIKTNGLCFSCYQMLWRINRHLNSPLIKCQCRSPECKEMIHSINTQGRPARYKHGHHTFREDNPNWNNGKINPKKGYIRIFNPKHHRADKNGYVREHILIMEKHLGRRLNPQEVIHHVDHNTKNNDISNLMLFRNHSEHSRFEYKERLRDKYGRFT